jgi:hypothetical protein
MSDVEKSVESIPRVMQEPKHCGTYGHDYSGGTGTGKKHVTIPLRRRSNVE